ncbi:hypothetical protein O3Q51_17235 [Cryomorphaceae bacterium 1068]|nr:hypothetical protein [Cryomorphaceae bacterium 1068]
MLRAEEIIDRITARFPDVSFDIRKEENSVRFRFSTEWQKEYGYSAWISVHREKLHTSIGASLIDEENKYFWYEPFDSYNAKKREEEWEDSKCFLESGIALLTAHPTKIIQRKSWIWISYGLYYFKDNTWNHYYTSSGSRWFDHPLTNEKEREWR